MRKGDCVERKGLVLLVAAAEDGADEFVAMPAHRDAAMASSQDFLAEGVVVMSGMSASYLDDGGFAPSGLDVPAGVREAAGLMFRYGMTGESEGLPFARGPEIRERSDPRFAFAEAVAEKVHELQGPLMARLWQGIIDYPQATALALAGGSTGKKTMVGTLFLAAVCLFGLACVRWALMVEGRWMFW